MLLTYSFVLFFSDGTVSLQELEDFLFPPKSSDDANEIGIVLDMCRKVHRFVWFAARQFDIECCWSSGSDSNHWLFGCRFHWQ